MRLLIFIFLISAIWSCGPGYHLRRSKHHQAKAIEKGANVDSLKTIKHDTIYIQVVTDKKDIPNPEPNQEDIDTVCYELKRVRDSTSLEVSKKDKIIKSLNNKLRKQLCPNLNVDSTYHIPFVVQGKEYNIPVVVKIWTDNNGAHYTIKSNEVKAPFVKEETSVSISAPNKFNWKCILIVIIALLAGYFLSFFKR